MVIKKLTENKKEKLPIDFLTSSASQGWSEVGNLKASLDGIKQNFSGTTKVEQILQDLIDAYLVYIGQLELLIDKKDYLELPDETDLKSKLAEDLEIIVKPENNKVVLDIKTTEDDAIAAEEPEQIIVANADKSAPFEYFCDFDDPVVTQEESSPYKAWTAYTNNI